MPSSQPADAVPSAQHAAQVEAAVRHWIGQARNLLELDQCRLPLPQLRFDLCGHAAGQAVLSRRRGQPDAIRINRQLLASHPRTMLEQTVPHEVAHVAIHRAWHGSSRRVKPHGREWQALMHAFGVPAQACHQLPTTPARRLRRFRYHCDCDEPVWLTSIRHRRALRGTIYRCRRCGQALIYQRESMA